MATRIVAPTGANPNAHSSQIDAVGQLCELAIKLNALLLVTYGDSGEEFRALPGGTQDAYLWTCSDMAREIKERLDNLEYEVCHG